MKITSIKQQVKNPQRVSLFLEGKYSFSLSLDELVKYGIKNGDELTAAELKKFKKLSEDGKLRARALEWLLNRPHSVREFRDYMYRKKADPELTESLVNEFYEKNYLNDRKFAGWYIELGQRKNKSARAIRSELFKKGVDRETLDSVLEESELDELGALKALVSKKISLPRYRSDSQKLMRYLIGQGFSYQDIKKVLNLKQEDS